MGGGGRLTPGTVADRGQRASEAARAAFSDAQGPSVPCATCPPPGTPDTELDGALIGRGCRALTNPRAAGRLKPRQDLVGFADTGMGGQVPVFADRPEDVGVKRQGLTRDEVTRALQRAHMVQPTSACCVAVNKGREQPKIVYTNGILTDLRAHCETLRRVAEATCASVVGVYNATEGPVSDLMQVAKDRSLIREAAAGKRVPVGDRRNPAVDSLRDLMVVSAQDPAAVGGQTPELWAHSQGGAITSLALYDATFSLNALGVDEPFADTRVTSFNAAAPRWIDGPRYTHFAHVGDFVAMRTGIGPFGHFPEISGQGSTVVEFSELGGFANALNRSALHATAEEPYMWREYRNGQPTDRGFGEPMPSASGWNPAVTSHHDIDKTGLDIYRQHQTATGGAICPEDTAPRSTPRAHDAVRK